MCSPVGVAQGASPKSAQIYPTIMQRFLMPALLTLISASQVSAQGLISRHRLDEPVGSTVALNDIPSAPSGAYLNGVVVGSGTSIVGGGANFDGNDDRIDFTGSPALNSLTDNFTVTCWVKTGNVPFVNRETLVACGSWAFGVQFTPLVTPTPELVLSINTGAGVMVITAPCNCLVHLGPEYFVSMVVAPGGAVTFYAQDAMFSNSPTPLAVLPGSGSGPVPVAGTNGQWTIGGNSIALGGPHSGQIADVQIFDRALSQAELEMMFDVPGSTFGIGTNFCQPVPNSTGLPGGFEIFGSGSIATNTLHLASRNLPPGELCYYLAQVGGSTNFVVPAGSAGPLCIVTSLNRISVPIGQISSGGTYTRTLDLSAPIGLNSVQAMPGETWRFQLWHRDWDVATSSPISNFTNGSSIVLN